MDAQRMLAILVLAKMQSYIADRMELLASERTILTPASFERVLDEVHSEVTEYLEKLRLVGKG